MQCEARTFTPADLTSEQIASLSKLWMTVWPSEESSLEYYIARFATRTHERPDRRIHAIFEHGIALAAAETFSRIVHTAEGSFFVLALAAVCSDPTRRGQGLGAAVVRSAFERVERGEFSVSLFQSPVPAFYERMGARTVANAFGNKLHPNTPAKNPFWDPYVMIYPETASWPQGSIDLNGPGY